MLQNFDNQSKYDMFTVNAFKGQELPNVEGF